MSMYPESINKNLVGEYPALSKSGGGYFYDEVLEYRVWCRPWEGAPDEFEGEVYYYVFHIYEEALKFSETTDGSEEPLVLIKQYEWIDEPEPGNFVHETGERVTEWRCEWLPDSKREAGTIVNFIEARNV